MGKDALLCYGSGVVCERLVPGQVGGVVDGTLGVVKGHLLEGRGGGC